MARVGEEFPLECPGCGGDIRLIALHPSRGQCPNDCRQEPAHVEPEVRKRAKARMASPRVQRRLRQSLLPAARPPTGESSSRSTFDRAIFQASPVELPDIDIHSL